MLLFKMLISVDILRIDFVGLFANDARLLHVVCSSNSLLDGLLRILSATEPVVVNFLN